MIFQSYYRMPYLDEDSVPAIVAHATEVVTRAFYDQVEECLRETPGGIILGQPRVTVKKDDDWLFGTGESTTVSMSANYQKLPLPPEYRLIGGPADGSIVRTAGERVWLVPLAPPPPSLASYADPLATFPTRVAEYERQGDTSAYFYRRSSER